MEDADREVVREEARRGKEGRRRRRSKRGEMVLLVCSLAPGHQPLVDP